MITEKQIKYLRKLGEPCYDNADLSVLTKKQASELISAHKCLDLRLSLPQFNDYFQHILQLEKRYFGRYYSQSAQYDLQFNDQGEFIKALLLLKMKCWMPMVDDRLKLIHAKEEWLNILKEENLKFVVHEFTPNLQV